MKGQMRIAGGLTQAELEARLREGQARAFIERWLRKPRFERAERSVQVERRNRLSVAAVEAQRVVEAFERAIESGKGVRMAHVRYGR